MYIPDNYYQFEKIEYELQRIKQLHKRRQMELERAEREENLE